MFRELTRRERTKLNSLFSYWQVFDHFKDKKFLVKDKQIFMINDHKEFVLKNDPIAAGIKVCEVKKHLHLSLAILQLFVDKNCSKRVKVNDHAEQLFLYGRDIFRESIIEHTRDFHANDEVIVTNKYGEALGLGRAVCDHDKMNKEIVIINLRDLGIYLREEKYEEIAKITKKY